MLVQKLLKTELTLLNMTQTMMVLLIIFFVYYAGYNEAENAPATTIWPHRWSLANYNTKFNSKIIYNYACTSELRGSSGSNMCGIGTFSHEFGHVLGLVDYYHTTDANKKTLESWDIMDLSLIHISKPTRRTP